MNKMQLLFISWCGPHFAFVCFSLSLRAVDHSKCIAPMKIKFFPNYFLLLVYQQFSKEMQDLIQQNAKMPCHSKILRKITSSTNLNISLCIVAICLIIKLPFLNPDKIESWKLNFVSLMNSSIDYLLEFVYFVVKTYDMEAINHICRTNKLNAWIWNACL